MSASYCYHCGQKLNFGAKFCSNCGSGSDGSAPKTPTPQPRQNRVKLASELRGKRNGDDYDETDDDDDDVDDGYDGPASVPDIKNIQIQIEVGGRLQGTNDSSYASRRFKMSDLIGPQ